jgi:hypothetical protein
MGPECHREEDARPLRCHTPQLPCATINAHSPCDKYTHCTSLAVTTTKAYHTGIMTRIEIIKSKVHHPSLLPIYRWHEWSPYHSLATICTEIGNTGPSNRMVCTLHVRTLSHGPCLQTRTMSGHPTTHGSPQSSRRSLIATLLQPGRS